MRTQLRQRWIAACCLLALLTLCPIGAQAGIIPISEFRITDLPHGEIVVPAQSCYDGYGDAGRDLPSVVRVTFNPRPGFEVKAFKIGYESHGVWNNEASVSPSEYEASGMSATFGPKPITDAQILTDILNEYQAGAASLENETVVLSKSVRLSDEQRDNELKFMQGGTAITLKLANDVASIYNFKIEINGGDVIFEMLDLNAGFTASQIAVNSGSLTLGGDYAKLEKLTMTGGRLNVKEMTNGSFVRELVISGDATITGEYEHIPHSYKSWGSLASDMKVTAGNVTLKNVYWDGNDVMSILEGANVTMENVGSDGSGWGSSASVMAAITLKGGTLTMRDCNLSASQEPFTSLVKVESGTMNVEGGEYSVSQDVKSVFHLAGADGVINIKSGMIGLNDGNAVVVDAGTLNISGGNFYRAIVMNGGSLRVSAGRFLANGKLGNINIMANCDVALSGGYYPESNAVFIKPNTMEAASLLAPGYSFYTRKQEIRPDFRLSGTESLSSPIDGGTMLHFGQVKSTDATGSTNNCIEAAKSASVGPSGADVQITDLVGGDKEFLIKSEKGLAWVAASFNDQYNQLGNGTQYYANYSKRSQYIYKLTTDLDMSSYDWLPFSFFGKIFDGQGYHIRNLNVAQPSAAFLTSLEEGSMLANLVVSGMMKSVENEYGYGNFGVAAGLVGHNSGTIVNCGFQQGTVSAELTGNGCYVGGLTASNYGSVENSYMTGKVSCAINKPAEEWYPYWSRYVVGGIVGDNSGHIENSYHADGDVTCDNRSGKDEKTISVSVGNLVGDMSEYVSPAPTQTHCYDSPTSAADLNKNKDAHNGGNLDGDIDWLPWGKTTGINAGFPIHKNAPSTITPLLTLVKKGEDGAFFATYTPFKEDGTQGELVTIKAGDAPHAISGKVKLSFTATPSTQDDKNKIKLEKITKIVMELPEEDIEEKDIRVNPSTGKATMDYTMDGALSVIFTAYFTYEKIVVDKAGDSTVGEEGKTTSTAELDINAGASGDNPAEVTIKQVSVSGTTTISEATNATLRFVGANDMGRIVNNGTITMAVPSDKTTTIAYQSVENEGTFTDETGFITNVAGTAALAITPHEQIVLGSDGGKISTNITSEGVSESELSYFWQRLENGNWIPEKQDSRAILLKSASLLRADWVNTDKEIMINPGEEGNYRCWITREKEGVVTTLVTFTEVRLRSSEPDITYSIVTLPSVDGIVLTPAAGSYSVEEGASFSFSFTLEADYDQSTPIVKVGDKTIEPASDGKYEIKNINSDITISITGIVRNTTVGNAEVDSDALRVWGANGVLHIRSAHTCIAYIVTFGGQLYKAVTLPVGETLITIPQGSYIINIGEQSYKIRF